MACNDYIILESCIYRVLKKHFAGKSYYPLLLDFFHEVSPLMPLIGSCMRAATVSLSIMNACAQEGLHMTQQLRAHTEPSLVPCLYADGTGTCS